jgi:hypothetical protein
MPDTSNTSNQSSIQPSTGAQPPIPSRGETGVRVFDDVSDYTPLTLNAAFISLKLPPDVFKPELGGGAAS